MNTTCLIYEHFIILSPFEVFTYFVEIPNIKKSLEKPAVDYKLRTIYPGPENSFVSDYRSNGKQSPVFVISKETLDIYKQKNLPILSFDLASAYVLKNGIVICVTDSWIELLLVQNSYPVKKLFCTPEKIKTLLPFTDTDFLNIEKPAIQVYNLSKNSDIEIEVKKILTPTYKNIVTKQLLTLQTKTILKTCIIFKNPAKKNKFNLFFTILAIIFLFFTPYDIFLYSHYKKNQNDLNKIKNIYQKEKIEFSKIQKTEGQKHSNISEILSDSSSFPIYQLLDVIYKTNKYLKIDSFTMTGTSFHLTAEGVSALPVLENLKNNRLLSDVSLQQSVPSDFRGELFTISGKFTHD